MARQRLTPEQIIGKLREVEVMVAKGTTVSDASRQIGATEQKLYRWGKEYGGMKVNQARRMKELEAENARLKKLVADLSLDKMILKRGCQGQFLSPSRRRVCVEQVSRVLAVPAAGSGGDLAKLADRLRYVWPPGRLGI